MRTGLCRTDQVRCANMLENGVHPGAVAKKLRTSIKVVKAHTREAVDAATAKAKGIEVAAVKHAANTRTTASALAGAAKEILSQGPGTTLGEPVAPLEPGTAANPIDPEGAETEAFE